LDAKVTALQIGLPDYLKALFVLLGDEGLSDGPTPLLTKSDFAFFWNVAIY